MKKKMTSSLLFLLIFLSLCITFTACSDSDAYHLKEFKIAGHSFDCDSDDFIIRLKNDNRAEIILDEDDLAFYLAAFGIKDDQKSIGKWSENDGKVTITIDSLPLVFTRDGDRLIFRSDSFSMILEK